MTYEYFTAWPKSVGEIANFGCNLNKKMVKFRMLSQPLLINIMIQYLLILVRHGSKNTSEKGACKNIQPLGQGESPKSANLTHTEGSIDTTHLLSPATL